MDSKNSAMVFQALLDGLNHLRYETLCDPEDFSAFSDVADEWYKLEAIICEMLSQSIKNLENPNDVENMKNKDCDK